MGRVQLRGSVAMGHRPRTWGGTAMKTKIARWWRNATCQHHRIYVKAATGVEAAGYPNRGNATIGVVVCCARCDQRWAADVVSAIPADALARLDRASRPAPGEGG